jgi:hypothetical protein
MTDRGIEGSPDRLPHRAVAAVPGDVGEQHRDPHADERSPFEITQRDRVICAPCGGDGVDRIDRGLRHSHVDASVDRDDGPGVPPLWGDCDRHVSGRRRRVGA